ncbi:MAG: hypothetical protein IJX34_04970 [Clostridia bacterium]|nr:hypothetical protein [Clostridia bacterium]
MERKAVNTGTRNAKNIKKKKKQNDKARIVFLGIIIILGIFFIINKSIESKISNSVVIFTEALSEGKRDIASQYVTEDSVSFLSFEELPQNQELMNTFVKYLSIDIKKVKKDGDAATVKAKISNKDFEKIMIKYMQEVVALSISSNDTEMTDEELENKLLQYLKDQFDSQENEILTNEVNINLVKVDGKWKIIIDDNLRNGMFPGMLKIIESMGPQNPQ